MTNIGKRFLTFLLFANNRGNSYLELTKTKKENQTAIERRRDARVSTETRKED